MRKPRLWDMALIVWRDVFCHNEGMTLAEVKEMKPCIRRTLGFIVRIDADAIVIAETDDRLANTDAEVERVNLIPSAYIDKLVILSEANDA